MSRGVAGSFRPFAFLCVALAAWSALWRASPAADPVSSKLVEQLKAGEYGPALETAKSLPDPTLRGTVAGRIDAARKGGPLAQAGGGAKADFDSLIELITNTTQPNTWKANGGQGDLFGFEGGVYCDPNGTLRRRTETDTTGALLRMREAARANVAEQSARRPSVLRKISLSRLEDSVRRAAAEQRPVDEETLCLAGLQRIQYVFLYPADDAGNPGDVVLAGPADDWQADAEGRRIGATSGAPVMQLDDLVVVLRHMLSRDGAIFGCSITPTKENLAKTQEFLAASTAKPLKPGQRDAWLKNLRATLGLQRIDVYGLDPQSRAANVLVEADYRMKLVGIGLEPSVLGVENYLDAIRVPAGQAPPAMDVLRWWFAMNYDAVAASPARDAFALRGQGVQVLSENELLAKDGDRQHTGAASGPNRKFTESFTKNFSALAKKYPVYAELRNLFDLALVGAILSTHDVPEKTGWRMTHFAADGAYLPRADVAPRQVETVLRHRVVQEKHILVGVSGGVRADPWKTAATTAIADDSRGILTKERAYHERSRPLETARWWWD